MRRQSKKCLVFEFAFDKCTLFILADFLAGKWVHIFNAVPVNQDAQDSSLAFCTSHKINFTCQLVKFRPITLETRRKRNKCLQFRVDGDLAYFNNHTPRHHSSLQQTSLASFLTRHHCLFRLTYYNRTLDAV